MSNHCSGSGGRGCACDFHTRRRRANSECARRKRERALQERLKTAHRCPKRQGKFECGGPLRVGTNGDGRTVVTCEWCERQRKGLCRDCPNPTYSRRARRCKTCAQKAGNASTARWYEEHREEKRAQYREHYHQPEIRARRCEVKRLWRLANPEKVRAQKQRYIQRHRDDPNSQYKRYHAKYRKKHGPHYRELQNTKNAIAREGWTPPPCSKCGKPTGWTPVPGVKAARPWSLCNRCVFPCERKQRRRIRREAAKRIAADPNFGLPQKPVKVVRPRAAAVRGPGFERLCITPGCDIVVTRRKKKCTKCRARDRELAIQALAPHSGRGHRADLEKSA